MLPRFDFEVRYRISKSKLKNKTFISEFQHLTVDSMHSANWSESLGVSLYLFYHHVAHFLILSLCCTFSNYQVTFRLPPAINLYCCSEKRFELKFNIELQRGACLQLEDTLMLTKLPNSFNPPFSKSYFHTLHQKISLRGISAWPTLI